MLTIPLFRAYTEQTDGTWIEDKEFSIVWHYEQADADYGSLQASELHKYLNTVLVDHRPSIEVAKYDSTRILEVKPAGINKGLTVTNVLNAVLSHRQQLSLPDDLSMPFIWACGDDRSDEEMFKAVDRFVNSQQQAAAAFAATSPTHSTINSSPPHPSTVAPASAQSTPSTVTTTTTSSSSSSAGNQRPDCVFTSCVGQRPSSAGYYLQDETEVISRLHSLAVASSLSSMTRQNSPALPPTVINPQRVPTMALGLGKRGSTSFADLSQLIQD